MLVPKDNAKECSNYRTSALISHASKVKLKTLQARLQQYVNKELPDVQARFRKGRETRDQIANICRIIDKAVAAAAAKSLQSCLTLCDSIDGSPSGFPVHGILQARTLEWGAIAFSEIQLGNSKKPSTSASLTQLKLLTVWITRNCGKFLRTWEYQTTLPVS